MRKKIIEAVQDHGAAQGTCTGFFLVTFRNGEVVVSGHALAHDKMAAEIIRVLSEALGEDDQDEIGRCWGTA